MKIRGIVLAGGLSRRFGTDKALAKVGGQPLIVRTVALLESLGLETAVITNAERDYSFLDCPVRRDLIHGKGPLGGLFTACTLFKGRPLLMVSCDMPGLAPEGLERLLKAHQSASAATLYRRGNDRYYPFPGVYETTVGSLAAQQILENRLSLHEFVKQLESLGVLHAETAEKGDSLFFNLNYSRDLRAWNDRRVE